MLILNASIYCLIPDLAQIFRHFHDDIQKAKNNHSLQNNCKRDSKTQRLNHKERTHYARQQINH